MCRNGTHRTLARRIRRHDQILRYIASVMKQACRTPIIGPRTDHNSNSNLNSRPDIRALGIAGGEDLLDVVISHPMQASANTPHTAKLLNHRYTPKFRQHATYAATIPGSFIRPIAIASTKGWHPESYAYMLNAANSISDRDRGPSSDTSALIFSRIATQLFHLNAICLPDGHSSRNNTEMAT